MTIARQLSQRARFFGQQPIGELMRLALARPELISLAAGFVDQASLPVDEARCAIATVLADLEGSRAALQYGTNAGYLPLREAVLDRLLVWLSHSGYKDSSEPLSIDSVIGPKPAASVDPSRAAAWRSIHGESKSLSSHRGVFRKSLNSC